MTVVAEARTRVAPGARSRTLKFLPATVACLDALIIAVAVTAAVWGRMRLPMFESPADLSGSLAHLGPTLVIGWLLCIYFMGGYRADVFGAGTDEYRRVANAALITCGLLCVVCYTANYSLSRGFFFLAFATGMPLLLLERAAVRRLLHRARLRGNLMQGVLIAGSAAHIDEIVSVLRREAWLGYRVIGAVTPISDPRSATPSGLPVVGHTDEIVSLVDATDADVLFLADGAVKSGATMRQLVWRLEQESVQLVVAPSVTDVSAERIRVRPVGGLPLMHIEPPTWADASSVGKRAFDIAGSLLLLVWLTPVFLASALAVKLADHGPVLFRQTRVGRGGAEFTCLKFRSMVTDAEARLAELHAEQGYENGLFKMENDPRVTRPGRWLRRLSLDELPQLVNVLRGDMSLVGPRPPLPSEVARYEDDAARRLHVRPGITGLWQVSGRSDLSWEEAIRLDLYYVDNWSMLQDVQILKRTVAAVLGSKGAY